MKIKLSIVILSYNRIDELKDNIPRICDDIENRGLDYELIVVDNASTDGSQGYLKKIKNQHRMLNVILADKNYGVAKGRNIGYKKANGKYILSIDDDTKLNIDNIKDLVLEMNRDSDTGIISPIIKHYKTQQYQCYHGDKSKRIANFHGACYLIKREILVEVGYLDEECTFGGEELDYSIRSFNKGFNILYTPNVLVYHNNYIRSGEEGTERRYKWVYNFIRVHFKHFPLVVAIKFSFRYLISHLFNVLKKKDIFGSFSIIKAAVKGAIIGKQMHRTVSTETTVFYDDISLRPDFGNKPLYMKFRQ